MGLYCSSKSSGLIGDIYDSWEEVYANSYNEVKDKFTQQEFQIRDSSGRRWIQCELCGEIKPESEFGSYGGTNHVNLGVCYKCSRRDKQ